MEIAKLILEFLRILIWPVIILIAIFLFRPHLKSILGRLKSASIPGGISINLRDEIEKAKEISQDLPRSVPPEGKKDISTIPLNEVNARMISLGLNPSPSGLNPQRYRDLAKQDPNVALAGIRMEMEILGTNIAKGFNVDITNKRSSSAIFTALHNAGAITSDEHLLVQKIISVSNAAIHGAQVSEAEANDVIDVAEVLATRYVGWLSWGFVDD